MKENKEVESEQMTTTETSMPVKPLLMPCMAHYKVDTVSNSFGAQLRDSLNWGHLLLQTILFATRNRVQATKELGPAPPQSSRVLELERETRHV